MSVDKEEPSFSNLSHDNVNDVAKFCFEKRNEPSYASTERYLNDLFRRDYPKNTDTAQVYAKVHALNVLYGAGVRSVDEELMAKHIVSIEGIDDRIGMGCEEIIGEIAHLPKGSKYTTKRGDEVYKGGRTYYVFATKFCSFSQPDLFPIVDSTVRKLLCGLFGGRANDQACRNGLSEPISISKLNRVNQYGLYKETIRAFMKWYGSLGPDEDYRILNFKSADVFLWTYQKYWKDIKKIIQEIPS